MSKGAPQVPAPRPSKHSPAPWKYDWRHENGETHCGVYFENFDGQAYAVARCPRYQTRERWEADARLIAAAPDLLAICQEFLSKLGPGGYHPGAGAPATQRMRNAVAKAESPHQSPKGNPNPV